MSTKLQTAIILTVAYSDQFQYPLTAREIVIRLLWRDAFLPSPAQVAEQLIILVQLGALAYSQGYFYLPGNDQHVTTRRNRTQFAHTQRQELTPLIAFLQNIPWIQGIVITGSLAMNAITKKDDSDFLLLVAPKRLWLTRLIVTIFAWYKGKRRSWQREEDNSWCFNLWLDTQHLAVPQAQHSVYSAYEVLQADWVRSNGALANQFYLQNSWVARYLPYYWLTKKADSQPQHYPKNTRIFGLSQLIDALDWFSYLLQLWYMQPHRTRERVGRGEAFFHPRDTRSLVNSRWLAGILSSYGISKSSSSRSTPS